MHLGFGIAKLVEVEAGDAEEPLTRMDQRLLTPEYASPEQIRGEALTTASDVYSLGVVLHQLLTGQRPEGREGEATTTPSTLVTRAPRNGNGARPDPTALAMARSTTPARLQKLLRGELDTVALKALRHEIDQRYLSAAALLDDLVRYREGRTISARAPTVAYRVGRFVRRNRVAVGAAGIAVASLVVGLGTALNQARIARQERDVAQSVSGFLENLFTSSNPFDRGERMDTLRIGAFLDQAVERLDTDLADQPVVRARMQLVLGGVYEGLGVYDRARRLLEASLASYRELAGPESPEVAQALRTLGRVARASGDAAAAEPHYRQAIAILSDRHGAGSPEVAAVQTELGGVLMTLDRLPEAEEVLQAAIDVRREQLEERSQEMANDLNLLSVLQYRQGRIDDAIVTMRASLDMNREVLGPDHPMTAVTTQNLGFVLQRQRRFDEAEPLLREALRALEAALGPDYPNLGSTMKTLAVILAATDRWPEADSLFQASIAFTRRTLGDMSNDMAIALHDYGGALSGRGEHARAVDNLREALRIQEELTGPASPGFAVTLSTLAEALRKQGDRKAAAAGFRRSVDLLSAAFPPSHPRVLFARTGVALTLADEGRVAEALDSLHAVHRDAEQVPDGGIAASNAAGHLADVYERSGDAEAAAEWRAREGASG